MAVQYNPKSYFYTEHSLLANADPANLATDAFGPVVGGETTQYRTTSFVRLLSPVLSAKVFAICKGYILIQPMQGDNTKINLILKPIGNYYAPLKIKYFIYRGVNKVDWIDSINNLMPKNLSDPLQPTFLQKLWDDYTTYYLPSGTVPSVFQGKRIGYNPPIQPSTTLIDTLFNTSLQGEDNYQLPVCHKGDYIGNFSGALGLDIVLDEGDYQLEGQEELFKLDLAYARKSNHVFDLGLITASSGMTKAAREKRCKEYIHRFLDAAAFWGSHIEGGKIRTISHPDGIHTNTVIYTNILQKYQTKNKVYVYIQEETARSYSYYDVQNKKRKVSFGIGTQIPAPPLTYYETNGWPILIQDHTISGTNIGIQGKIQYNIGEDVYKSDKCVSVDYIAPNSGVKSPEKYGEYPPDDDYLVIYFDIYLYSEKSCSSFVYVRCSAKQDVPLTEYFNNLWPVNIKPALPNVALNDCSYTNYDKGLMRDLTVVKIAASIQHKVFFDKGELGGNIVSRRLYVASIQNVAERSSSSQYTKSNAEKDYEKLNAKSVKSNNRAKLASHNDYVKVLYDDTGFSLYRSEFLDVSDNIPSLALTHETDFELKYSHFHLGITENEYDTLCQSLPPHFDHAFFHLAEVTSAPANVDFRKFELCIDFENAANGRTIATPTNKIYVYTLDGLYFFTKDYAASQTHYKEFGNTHADFRPVSDVANPLNNWKGEYGFDWPRIGDTSLAGDGLYTNPVTSQTFSRNYFDIIGHYYSENNPLRKLGPNDPPNGAYEFKQEKSEWIALRNNYPAYPSKPRLFHDISYLMYAAPVISLFPSLTATGAPTGFPKLLTNGNAKCYTEALLDLKITIPTPPTSLKIKYETESFKIFSANPSTPSQPPTGMVYLPNVGEFSYLDIIDKSAGSRTLHLRVKYLREASTYKKIQVIAVEAGVEKLVGELWAMPNAKKRRKQVAVELVSMKTDLGTGTKNGIDKDTDDQRPALEAVITRFLNHALIDVAEINTTTPFLEINATPTATGEDDYDAFNNDYKNPTSPPTIYERTAGGRMIYDDLYKFLLKNYPSISHNSKMVLFYIDEVCKGRLSGKPLYGLAHQFALRADKNTVALFRGSGIVNSLKDETSPHELLHTLGVEHTFGNQNSFTLKQYLSDNILDYSIQASVIEANDIPPISSMRVQWRRTWVHINIKNEA